MSEVEVGEDLAELVGDGLVRITSGLLLESACVVVDDVYDKYECDYATTTARVAYRRDRQAFMRRAALAEGAASARII